ncbi:MAG: lipocalin-like domain-containing protein [Ardenticatenales bacterium]
MRGRRRPAVILGLLLAAGACRPAPPPAVSADIVGLMSGPSAGFARADGPRPIVFPADEGPHPAYQTEWWYYTGQLFVRDPADEAAPPAWLREADVGDRRRFGFQLTFFRSSLAPERTVAGEATTSANAMTGPNGTATPHGSPAAPTSPTSPLSPTSAWTTDQAYLAHFALTDVAAARFRSAERLGRGALGLAGAVAAPYRVWLGPWFAAARPSAGPRGGHAAADGVRLRANDGPNAIDVTVRPVKPAALHGQNGWSRKGPEAGNASYYYSYTRLAATGVVTTADGVLPVAGGVWMDHEWSTSALADGRVGWDWLSLQLDDGRDIMAFQIRDAAGRPAPESSASLVDARGHVTSLGARDFALTPTGRWTSPRTGAVYPSGWRLTLPGTGDELRLTPLLVDQELSTGFRYWEGAVRVDGTAGGRAVRGRGYVELTGYAIRH